MFWKSFYADDIQPEIQVPPPPPGKKGPSRNKWFRHRSQICVFSGLVIGWWSKIRATHPYPTQSWVPPPRVHHTGLSNSFCCTLQTPKCMAVFCSDVTSHKYSTYLSQLEYIAYRINQSRHCAQKPVMNVLFKALKQQGKKQISSYCKVTHALLV